MAPTITGDAEDRSTWLRDGQVIRRDELLRLIEEKYTPEGLDLRGVVFVGDETQRAWYENPIDLRPEALEPLAEAYRHRKGGREPPWLHHGAVDLAGAQLQGANLTRAQLQGANLDHAGFEGAGLSHAQLQGARLRDAHLQGLDLSWAQLQGAGLSHAQLQGAGLLGAQFQGARLSGAQLQGAGLSGAHLQGMDMYEVLSLDGARWDGALLDHTRIRRETLGDATGDEMVAHERKTADDYHGAKEAYLLLKNNFNQIGRYEDASWAYVKEQQMEKRAFYREWRWRGWRARGSFWRWLRNWAYELLTGYGEHPWRPALWAVVVVAVFTAVYAGAGNIAPDFAGDPAAAQGSHSFLHALTHSIGAFATIGFNTLEPLGWGARLLTAVESALGIGLFALFIFTIGNRMSRG